MHCRARHSTAAACIVPLQARQVLSKHLLPSPPHTDADPAGLTIPRCNGLVFLLLLWRLWPLLHLCRLLAALLSGLMSLRFLLAGLGITREPRLVAGTAVSVGAGRGGGLGWVMACVCVEGGGAEWLGKQWSVGVCNCRGRGRPRWVSVFVERKGGKQGGGLGPMWQGRQAGSGRRLLTYRASSKPQPLADKPTLM